MALTHHIPASVSFASPKSFVFTTSNPWRSPASPDPSITPSLVPEDFYSQHKTTVIFRQLFENKGGSHFLLATKSHSLKKKRTPDEGASPARDFYPKSAKATRGTPDTSGPLPTPQHNESPHHDFSCSHRFALPKFSACNCTTLTLALGISLPQLSLTKTVC